MKKITLGSSALTVPAIAVGCMRLNGLSQDEADRFVHTCVDAGADFFDHADIYGAGECEELFGKVLAKEPALRQKMLLQSKCCIVPGVRFDASKEHILRSVEGSLRRLQTDHLDILLLHRPDALMEPEEIAAAFDALQQSGKVLHFGVSNMNPMQIELICSAIRQPLLANQLQLSIPMSNMIAQGLEVNMNTPGSVMRDGSVLDYCRLKKITVQAWSPFQKPDWAGPFIGAEDCGELNRVLCEIGEDCGLTATGTAAAWILRHPAGIQVVTGTMRLSRMKEILDAADTVLTREQWYRIYLAAGHILP